MEGVIRWGGDSKPCEALFYIGVPPGDVRLTQVAAKIQSWRTEAGAGTGASVDVLAGKRRSAVKPPEHRRRKAA